MARVTVEDCMEVVDNNRFKLCILAAKRAKAVSLGARMTVPQDNDKYPVIALREIAEGTIDIQHLEESIVQNLQKTGKTDSTDGEFVNSELAMDTIEETEFVEFDVDVAPADDLTFDEDVSFEDDNLDIED
ncbi:DNA-directed RNA polymerase subunit omega [Rickettsiales bacterium Ac37b]|nr:DNA-directed RNA polymerase subunit omega [Rickettsiales bacterium Ac37b]